MMRNKLQTFVLALLFVLPFSASAQSNTDDVYRSYLLQILELLQQQVAALQVEIDLQANSPVTPERNTEFNFESFLIEDLNDVEARYVITDSSQAAQISNRTHREYFTRFFELTPDEFDDYFIDLMVFDERGKDFDGFVETVSPYREDTWRLALNEAVFEFTTTSDLIEELFIHEFAHILSYDGIPGTVLPRNATCHEYFDEFGCPPQNSYLTDFIDEFWTDEDLDALVEFGDDNEESLWLQSELEENFVSDYAGTNPAEDFAESFTVFVLENKTTGNDVADTKINYFYQYPELVEMRAGIRDRL